MKKLLPPVILLSFCIIPGAQVPKYDTAPYKPDQFEVVIPKATWEPIFFKEINERAKIANLQTLRSARLPENDVAIRIWYGFGLTALRGFLLNRAKGEWSATYLAGIHPNLSTKEFQKTLQSPKSGWESCWRQLVNSAILRLPDASEIKCHTAINDGMSYVVEFNRNGIYRTYMYDNPAYARCPEAKQMIKIGKIISEEFGVAEMSGPW